MLKPTHKLERAAFAALIVGLAACSATTTARGPVAGATMGDKPVDHALAERGAAVWMSKSCYTCHAFGRRLAGPDLAGIMERRDHAWLRAWLLNTDSMIVSEDPQAKAMIEEWKGVKMPDMKLMESDIEPLFHYMAQETARARNAATQSQ